MFQSRWWEIKLVTHNKNDTDSLLCLQAAFSSGTCKTLVIWCSTWGQGGRWFSSALGVWKWTEKCYLMQKSQMQDLSWFTSFWKAFIEVSDKLLWRLDEIQLLFAAFWTIDNFLFSGFPAFVFNCCCGMTFLLQICKTKFSFTVWQLRVKMMLCCELAITRPKKGLSKFLHLPKDCQLACHPGHHLLELVN